ncbi:type 2 lanthipeptide synthetase LanM [Butyrivibrio sp. VCD2006]|uniref:type 2 lanthipeptide synthetase LanM n=1 Tax=Butyrivibrio sp. VCD2006 TaxID=1280664 RepID=UPI001A9A6810|nr:type 2 lanthipeptide synthetase LanM [Butyrivibrio sp. VCD2006]
MGIFKSLRSDPLTVQLGNEGVFDEFYNPILLELEDTLDKIENEIKIPLITDIRKDILRYAKENLMEYSARILIYELNRSGQEYEEFCESIANDPDMIYRKYPVLYKRLEKKVKSIAKNIREIGAALLECRYEIRNTFGVEVMNIKSIDFGEGDTHNGGRTVAILTFDKDKKLVFKPRDMHPENAFVSLSKLLNEWLFGYKLINPGLVLRDGYGFQEFIESKECRTVEEVRSYYRRIGRSMALFYILDTTDIHAENIIPHGEYPIFVDLESLTYAPRKKDNTQEGSLIYNVYKEFEHTVFTSNLLPCVFAGNKLDIDMSGLGATAGQKSNRLKCLVLEDKGTTNIHYEEKYFVTEEMPGTLRLNGEEVRYSDYLEDIEKGFDEAYEVLMEKKEYLITILPGYFGGGIYRQILRGTFVYARFIKASLHPKYCVSDDKVRGLLEIISPTKCNQSDSEIKQMANCDVPYFYAKFDDKALYSGNALVEKDYFEESIYEKITRNVNELSPEDKKRQLSFIHNGVRIAGKELMKDDVLQPERVTESGSRANLIRDIAKDIKCSAVWNSEKTACTFMDANVGENPHIGVISYTLYDGLGLILFLFAYALFTKDDEDMMFAEAALAGMEEIAPLEKAALSSSVFGGFFGYIYLYFNLYRMTGNAMYFQKYQKALDMIYEYDVTCENNFDVISGVSGAIIVLSNIYKYEKSDKLLLMIERYTSHLNRSVKKNKTLWTGFSHGYAGYQYAFTKAFEATKKVKYLKYAEKMEQLEDEFFNKHQRNWLDLRDDQKNCCSFWCHGAPGILLARSYFMEKNLFRSRYREVIHKIILDLNIYTRGTFNDSLCHGRVGNLDALSTIAKNIGDRKLLSLCRTLFVEEEQQLKREGAVYGIPQLKRSMSFMLGMPGIGYGLLRQITKGLPLVLSLEIV